MLMLVCHLKLLRKLVPNDVNLHKNPGLMWVKLQKLAAKALALTLHSSRPGGAGNFPYFELCIKC